MKLYQYSMQGERATMTTDTAIDTATEIRPMLGSNVHLICFQYLCKITDDLTGRAPIITASRSRGIDAMTANGLADISQDPQVLCDKLNQVLGASGTRLCAVNRITSKPNSGYEARLSECACSAGFVSPEPACNYTLGVITGTIQTMTGMIMRGVETECQAMGVAKCVYQIDPI